MYNLSFLNNLFYRILSFKNKSLPNLRPCCLNCSSQWRSDKIRFQNYFENSNSVFLNSNCCSMCRLFLANCRWRHPDFRRYFCCWNVDCRNFRCYLKHRCSRCRCWKYRKFLNFRRCRNWFGRRSCCCCCCCCCCYCCCCCCCCDSILLIAWKRHGVFEIWK